MSARPCHPTAGTGCISTSTPGLLLEAVLSMPLKEMRMRPFEDPAGCTGETVLVDQSPHAFLIVHSPRDQDLQVVRERDQPPIEHPVCRAGKRETVTDDVGTILLDRPDMGSVDFGTTAAVYQPKSRPRASLAVGS